MATASMSGPEFAGRVFALEALLIALASEVLAQLPEDRVAGIFAGVREIAHGTIDDMSPALAPRPKIMAELEEHANGYVDSTIDRISRARAEILKHGALVKPES